MCALASTAVSLSDFATDAKRSGLVLAGALGARLASVGGVEPAERVARADVDEAAVVVAGS